MDLCGNCYERFWAIRTLLPPTLGRQVIKTFDDGPFTGTITQVWFHDTTLPDAMLAGQVAYHVLYSDGDEEDLDEDELWPLLQ